MKSIRLAWLGSRPERERQAMATPRPVRTVLLVAGMKNSACRAVVAAALEAVRGVLDVDVNLIRARATVSHGAGCETADLVGAVRRAGYGAAVEA